MDDLQKRYAEWKAQVSDPNYKKRKLSHAHHIAALNHSKLHNGKTASEWAVIHNTTDLKINQHFNRYGNLDKINDEIEVTTINGKTVSEWSKELNRTQQAIREYYAKHGHLNGCGKKTKTYNGKTVYEWAEELNTYYKKINDHLNKYGHLDYVINDINPRIKTVYEGKTYKQLEAEYGINSRLIREHLKLHGNLNNLSKKQ